MSKVSLSLADQVCLAVVGEGRTHGWAIVKLLTPDGELGRIWSLSRPLCYRSIDRLAAAGLIARADSGRRTELRITATGRRTTTRWLEEPVTHLRDLRTEFLLKLALRRRAGLTIDGLVDRQSERLAPTIASLLSTPAADPVELWRQESATAARRFLDQVADLEP